MKYYEVEGRAPGYTMFKLKCSACNWPTRGDARFCSACGRKFVHKPWRIKDRDLVKILNDAEVLNDGETGGASHRSRNGEPKAGAQA